MSHAPGIEDFKQALDHAAIVATADVSGRINDLMVFARPRSLQPGLVTLTLLVEGTLIIDCPATGGTVVTLSLPLRPAASRQPANAPDADVPGRTSRSDNAPGRD